MPDNETFERSIGTLALFFVWAAIVLGPMFFDADPPRWELQIGITMIAFTILGKMWDFETQRLLNGVIAPDGGRPRDDDRDDD